MAGPLAHDANSIMLARTATERPAALATGILRASGTRSGSVSPVARRGPGVHGHGPRVDASRFARKVTARDSGSPEAFVTTP